jgi:hypothetical protein
MNELLPVLLTLINKRFPQISKPLRTNLAVLTVAFLKVLAAVRSGNGRLSLAALARALPTSGSPHSREKRLHRFLSHQRLDYRTMTTSLAPLLTSARKGLCPIILDQTKSGNAQALVAAVPYAGRALPLSLYTFSYPLTEPALLSQNYLEHIFLLDIETALPPRLKGIWIADRGYARALLLLQNEQERRLYIIRGRGNTVITHDGFRMKLKQLPAPPGQAIRYQNVLYHAKRQVCLDVVVYHQEAFKEPWYLLVPPAVRSLLTSGQVVDLYRERMQIEQSFRDFKTHLGLRGLNLQVDVAARMGRLLLAFCLAYVLCVLLGDSQLGHCARQTFEIPRRQPRHGTSRTLSALSVAMLMLSQHDWFLKSLHYLLHLITYAARSHPLLPPSAYLIPLKRYP